MAAENWNRKTWFLAGPVMLSNISVPLLGAVDTAVVGHLPGPHYLGAVAVGLVDRDHVGDFRVAVGNHSPRQVGNFFRPQTGLDGQEKHHPVALRVACVRKVIKDSFGLLVVDRLRLLPECHEATYL